jgi:O-antigen/teichoic acid export membrane protein
MTQNDQNLNIEKHGNKNILFGTIVGYFSIALSIVSGVLFTPLILSYVGKSGYALYTLASSLISMFLFNFGMSSASNTFLAKYRSEGNEDKIRTLISIIYKIYFFIDVLLLLIFTACYFLIDVIYTGLTVSERADFKILFLISAGFSLVSFPASSFDGIISAFEEHTLLKLADLLNRVLFIGLTFFAIFGNLGLFWVCAMNALSGLACVLAKYCIVRFKIKIKGNPFASIPFSEIKPILKFSIWAGIIDICWRLFTYITPTILGIVSDSNNIAVFNIMASIENYSYTIGTVMNSFFFAKIVRITKENDEEAKTRFMDLSCRVGRYQFALMCLILSGFIVCGKDFISIWTGGDSAFNVAYTGIIILLMYQVIYVPEVILRTAMYTANHVTHLALSQVISTVCYVGLSFLFCWLFGALGAAAAVFISKMIELAISNIFYSQDLQFNVGLFVKKVFPKTLIAFAVAVAFGLCVKHFTHFSEKLELCILAAAVIVAYCPACFFLTFEKEERKRMLSKFHFRHRKTVSKASK